MLDQIHLLAAVTVLGVLEQAYFFLQVIYARRAFGISPPKISGPPEFDRIFRAQVNSSEYFPIFLALLWQAGLFFHQGLAAALGLVYLYARYQLLYRIQGLILRKGEHLCQPWSMQEPLGFAFGNHNVLQRSSRLLLAALVSLHDSALPSFP
ncbi:leukotriene C4 synthase-like isoform X2 [Strigops habroptila]|uniref:leukotriene C4 synthase-like isoform X2 n=1 Tax=Strigops habroptila TaxID=2489341 RepID=UPI0011CF4F6B|nr:leukotriene C4 synthase-like isoform X2 [Strigops habroptila]